MKYFSTKFIDWFPALVVISLFVAIFFSAQVNNQPLSAQELRLDSVKKELITVEPGDIIEFNDERISPAVVRVNFCKQREVNNPCSFPELHLGSVDGRYLEVMTHIVPPETVRHIYHKTDPDWSEGAKKLILWGSSQ